MKTRTWLPIVLVSLLSACTYTDGQCWLRSDDNGGTGAGGGVIVPPYGGGDNGDVPPTPQDATDSVPPDCLSAGQYSPSLFKFATVIADDGKGLGGGWQEATATVNFVDDRQDPIDAWSCTVNVGMAIRSSTLGVISPTWAASVTASVLTYASSLTMHSRPKWIQALFCGTLKDNMNKMFGDAYGGTGAKVKAQ